MKNKFTYLLGSLAWLFVPLAVCAQEPTIAEMLQNILNFLLGIFALLAVIGFVAAGFMYLTAGGDENQTEKAKKIATYTTIGLVIGLLSVTIVRTLNDRLSGL